MLSPDIVLIRLDMIIRSLVASTMQKRTVSKKVSARPACGYYPYRP